MIEPPTRAPEGECIAAVWVSDVMEPCNAPATGWAHDAEDADVHPDGGWFPACDEHRVDRLGSG